MADYSELIKAAFVERRTQGLICNDSVPLGFKIARKRLVHDKKTAHIAQDIFDTFESNHSMRKTLLYINKKHGTKILYNALRNYLSNPLYIGEHRGNKEYCKPLISIEQFNNVQQILNSKTCKNTSTTNNTYFFSSLCVCDSCGTKMTGGCGTNKEYKYYVCNKFKQSRLCDNKKVFNEARLEKYLLNNYEHIILEHLSSIELSEESKNQLLENNFRDVYYTFTPEEKQKFWHSIIKEIRVYGREITAITLVQ